MDPYALFLDCNSTRMKVDVTTILTNVYDQFLATWAALILLRVNERFFLLDA